MNAKTVEKDLFKNYIGNRKILVADSSAVARSTVAHVLGTLGIRTTQIVLCANYALALEEIDRSKPKMIVCDYDLGRQCGLDLLQRQRESNPDAKENLFVLITSNTSQTAVAKAAEEDVDTYVIKPFSPETLRTSILRATVLKVDPPDYIKAIETGKQHLSGGNVQEAIVAFERAKALDDNPSLAYFYIGQAKKLDQALDDAQQSYLKGLQYSKIHYKCLIGLYEVLYERKHYQDAYKVLQRLAHYFPANPQRLSSVMKLAVVTHNYDDIEKYYDLYTHIEDRNEEMTKVVCAALVVCGRYHLKQGRLEQSLEIFQKAATAGMGRTKILREIILTLVEAGQIRPADDFLRRFPPETQSSGDYFAMDLLLMEHLKMGSLVIERGRDLLAQGFHDPVIYQVMIRRSREAGLKHAVDDLVREIGQRWPEAPIP